MVTFIAVASFASRIEAEIARGVLATQGIQSIIMADDAGGMRPYPMAYTYGVELKVSKEDVQQAKELLTNLHTQLLK